jgi:type IV secretion system protein TrbF
MLAPRGLGRADRIGARAGTQLALHRLRVDGAGLISTSGAVVLGVKKQVATYVVEVDKAGMPGRITLASEPYQPDAAQVGYFVGEVVRLVRERPLDPVVMRQQWTKAYQFLAGRPSTR